MNDQLADLTDFLSSMKFMGFGNVSLKQIAYENKKLLKALAELDPILAASSFSGLLVVPELQSNCLRLEVLVHLALSSAQGKKQPNVKTVSQQFSLIGKGWAGRCEDPAEDIFVSSIATPRGNYRILEGIWESGGFYLQRIVNIVDTFPQAADYDWIRECVYALLRLSDKVCERAHLSRNQLGNPIPLEELPPNILSSLDSLRAVVKFSKIDLEALGISEDQLAEFEFAPALRSILKKESIGHSTLERFPLAYSKGEFFFLLPTATSATIRRYVFEKLCILNRREPFITSLALEYAWLFSATPLLGGHIGAPVDFCKTENGMLAGVLHRVDQGLYINLVFLLDTLEDFESTGLIGTNPNPTLLADDIDHWIDEAYTAARNMPDFQEIITLLVGCGIGRSAVYYTSDKKRENWRFEFISASDFLTLSWMPKFKPLSLWRLLDMQKKLLALGVELQNANGLLNLVAWWRSLGGHLIPHGDLPDNFGTGDQHDFLVIEQNALLSLRHEVAVHADPHVALDIHGRWLRIRKDEKTLFEEDRHHPFYLTEVNKEGHWPLGVYETVYRTWWCELKTQKDTPGFWAYERWKMLRTWICRIVPVLEPALTGLSEGAVLLCVKFDEKTANSEKAGKIHKLRTMHDVRASINLTIDASVKTVFLVAGSAFEEAIFHPENIAERALVEGIVDGFAALAGWQLNNTVREMLIQKIVPDTSARQSHKFITRNFRDFVRGSVESSPITINKDDAALIKLGLGWRVRDRTLGGDIHGKEPCTNFLNGVVCLLEDELCKDLQQFDRESVIRFALENHESAVCDRDNWQYSAAALLSLHSDRDATLQTIAEHMAKLNAVFQATRLLVEFAICECPLTGGRKPGQLDISRLMAKAMLIPGLGGWSDAIHWEAMEPFIRVTPLGDIHAKQAFQEEVLAPFGRAGSDRQIEERVRNYEENFKKIEAQTTDKNAYPVEFMEAWQEEFNSSFNDARIFIDFIEDIGIEAGKAVLKIQQSKLLDAYQGENQITPRAVAALVERLTFKNRLRWRDVPDGYDEKDRQPWRFRRRLSILRKPLIQLDEAREPTVILAPGLVRDAFAYMLRNYYYGGFPSWQLKPKMNRWAAKIYDQTGREFSQTVAKRLHGLGWNTETDIKITKLLRKGFDRDFGDVDVLAWKPECGRVLIIECKDVQFRKTDGEIAEQLSDFRGELRSNGKPDYLMLHLNRFELISQHKAELKKFIKMRQSPHIESHLVFKNPVPMQFAWKRMEKRVSLHIFDELDQI